MRDAAWASEQHASCSLGLAGHLRSWLKPWAPESVRNSVSGAGLCSAEQEKQLASSCFVFAKCFKHLKARLSFLKPTRWHGTLLQGGVRTLTSGLSLTSRKWLPDRGRPGGHWRLGLPGSQRVYVGDERGRARIHFRPAPGLWLLMTERWNSILSHVLLFNLGTGQRNRKTFLLSFPFLISLIILGPNVEGKWNVALPKWFLLYIYLDIWPSVNWCIRKCWLERGGSFNVEWSALGMKRYFQYIFLAFVLSMNYLCNF